jgi:hypothetical protein
MMMMMEPNLTFRVWRLQSAKVQSTKVEWRLQAHRGETRDCSQLQQAL